jgi:hypothetical protein
MAEENPVAEGTRGLIRGAVVVCCILILIFAALFAASRFRGSEEHSGKPSASYDVHTRQLT